MAVTHGGSYNKAGQGVFGQIDISSIRTLRFVFTYVTQFILLNWQKSPFTVYVACEIKEARPAVDYLKAREQFLRRLFVFVVSNWDCELLRVPDAEGEKVNISNAQPH